MTYMEESTNAMLVRLICDRKGRDMIMSGIRRHTGEIRCGQPEAQLLKNNNINVQIATSSGFNSEII
jgi:hypothetical protein